MIELDPSPGARALWDALARFFESLSRPPRGAQRQVGEAVREGFADNFADESAGGLFPWAELAESTARDRRRQGYAPYSPILVRSGDYRSAFVNEADPDHGSALVTMANGWAVEEWSEDYRVQWHEEGTERMPARPATHLSWRSELRIGDMLDELYEGLEP